MTTIGAIILAAGMSSRMGQPKQWLRLHGKPLFLYSVETAVRNGLDPVYLVGGEHADQLRAHVPDLPVTVLYNPDFVRGMSTSLQVGITAMDGKASAAFIFLADQPFVPDTVIQGMVTAFQSSQASSPHSRIIRPRYAGVPGHPVLFSADFFPELLQVEGDEGARSVILKHSAQVNFLHYENPLWGFDVDTHDDWEKILTLSSGDHLLRDEPWRWGIPRRIEGKGYHE